MNRSKSILTLCLLAILFLAACGPGKEEKVRNGVMYATRALQQAGANPFSRATYQGIVGRGGNPADFIKTTLPKKDPPFDSFEYNNPSHAYTVVIRPGTDPGEYFIEGYGADLKKPLMVDSVVIDIPSE